MDRALPRRDYYALKAATRHLMDQAGGARLAEQVTDKSHNTLWRYGSLEHMDRYIPVDVVADLEEGLPHPIITQALAELAGYTLVKVPAPDAPADLKTAQADTVERCGAFLTSLSHSLTSGPLSDPQKAHLRKECLASIAALAGLCAGLDGGASLSKSCEGRSPTCDFDGINTARQEGGGA
ncbi:MAG: hypothetical protein AAF468_12435 [Pseudomonadota bacterium]